MKRVKVIITTNGLKIVSFVVITNLSLCTFEFAHGKTFSNIDEMSDYVRLVLKNNHFYVKVVERAFDNVVHEILYQDVSDVGKFYYRYTTH